ncbi:PD-(D/E)XK nuclease family protein [Nitrosomonas sp.]|uniref:PD-(D/E)XK nuclease family protein n=1 Tax=Nitrosomonas sp. TaxID=42353 RepID=UPI001D5BD804|nr:PD-(D/E)XK nuclease family protein [Nitrosomonas sp.]MBX3618192.1 PD-(D/E)XK nuclease family protein [Nitrosomonas sp.]
MFDSSKFPEISPHDVFKRLNAGGTVITPNRRLALALKEKFNQYQIDQKKTAWHSADILPFTSFIDRLYHDALYSVQFSPLPLLLSDAQEQMLWESVIQQSEVGKTLLRVSQTAQLAREAWQLAHAWQLISQLRDHQLRDHFPNEDGSAFLEWMESYRNITALKRLTDQARICDLITEYYESLNIKKCLSLICYGFDVITPQQKFFLEKMRTFGCEIVTIDSLAHMHGQSENIQRLEYLNSRDEIYQAAVWARSKIDKTGAAVRVGIVVPALANYRSALIRTFYSVLHPDVRSALPASERPVTPMNVSLGLTLSSYPVIDAAIAALTLVDQEVDFYQVSHWLCSPFLKSADTEMGQRALLEKTIRRFAEPVISLPQLLKLAKRAKGHKDCPILFEFLVEMDAFRQEKLPSSGSHSDYVKVVTEILRLSGFPGERSLNSDEYQTVEKWQSILADFAALDHVTSRITYHEAINRLKWMVSDTLFQPESPEAPVQILGVLEAAGMEFDYLWVMALSDDQWPLRARPNPFLPLALQRKAKLTLGSAQESSVFCRRLMQKWFSHAKEVIVSSPKYRDGYDQQVLEPSALIRSIPIGSPVFPDFLLHRDLIIRSCEMERIEDSQALPLPKEIARQGIRGGTSVIKDYAACPFRAWTKHRLNIESFDEPHTGLNARERGSLVHQTLADVWGKLITKTALDEIDESELDRLIAEIAGSAISVLQQTRPESLPDRLLRVEQRRLIQLIREWLNGEKKRDCFIVVAIEEKCDVQLGDLKLSMRLDRVDELMNGQHIIIDYKTSKQSIQSMIGERADEPQLPLYLAISDSEKVTAGIAFGIVKLGEVGFAALMSDSDLLPGVKDYSQLAGFKSFNSWQEVIAALRQNLTNLADGFCSGEASVDPKKIPATCEFCDMHMFCRIYERVSDLNDEED